MQDTSLVLVMSSIAQRYPQGGHQHIFNRVRLQTLLYLSLRYSRWLNLRAADNDDPGH